MDNISVYLAYCHYSSCLVSWICEYSVKLKQSLWFLFNPTFCKVVLCGKCIYFQCLRNLKFCTLNASNSGSGGH